MLENQAQDKNGATYDEYDQTTPDEYKNIVNEEVAGEEQIKQRNENMIAQAQSKAETNAKVAM